ncbi:MAG: trimethylamine methyltransferase family protein, partial [Eubacterium sp.]
MNEIFDRFKQIDRQGIESVHQYTVEILSQRGVWVESERARAIYKKHGCIIDGKMVKINEKLLNEATQSLPSQFDITPIDPCFKQTFGGDHYAFGLQGGATYISEADGSRRVSTLKDTNDFFKLAQYFDLITVNNKIAWPLDIPTEHQHLMLTYSQIINNDKIWNPTMFTVDLVCMALGITPDKIKSDAERGLHHFYCGVNPVSPLEHTTLQTDYTIFYAEYGIPSIVSSMPIGGISAPASVEAVILQNNIEVLSSMVLSYLVNPKAPVI